MYNDLFIQAIKNNVTKHWLDLSLAHATVSKRPSY